MFIAAAFIPILLVRHTGWKGVIHCWRSKSRSPKLWKSAIIGVIYWSHCSPISSYVTCLVWFTGRMWPQCSFIHFVHLNDWHQVLIVCVFCSCCIMILVDWLRTLCLLSTVKGKVHQKMNIQSVFFLPTCRWRARWSFFFYKTCLELYMKLYFF